MITSIMCYFKGIKCYFVGHKYKPAIMYLLQAKECTVCNNRQVKIPSGNWVDSKK